MLIREKETLKKYAASKRLWQGIPSIEVTKGGRIFLTFYSGGIKEEIGNFAVLVKSDNGVDFSEPILAAFEEDHRCFDPCLWIDPIGRLWFTWTRFPDDGLFGAICEDPDAQNIVFGDEFFIGHDVMMDKPTALSNGKWLFPLSVWSEDMAVGFMQGFGSKSGTRGAHVYETCDKGKSFDKLGFADIPERSYDEHQVLEMKDGRLRMFIRCSYGIGAADSFDGGKTWSEGFDTGYKGPSSRFCIRRLKSGRVLFINHYDYIGRNNLTALLSDDDGKSFPYRLLLDERNNVSYPDFKEADDGYIYITYDRERGYPKNSMNELLACAREVLIAKITEDDIICGKVKDKYSCLKQVAVKLGAYDGDIENPYGE